MGVLLMLLTIGGLAAAGISLFVAAVTKRNWLLRFTFGGTAVWLTIYAVMLVGTSIASSEKTLPVNEAKEYCGFYLDCHLHTLVKGVRTVKTIGDRTANGNFRIVNVRVFLDSRNPEIAFRLLEPRALAVDRAGREYSRDLEAEAALPSAGVSLNADIKGRETIEKEIVFDLPVSVTGSRVLITEGYGIDKFIESVLIGDEDSILHKKIYFDISEQTGSAGVLNSK